MFHDVILLYNHTRIICVFFFPLFFVFFFHFFISIFFLYVQLYTLLGRKNGSRRLNGGSSSSEAAAAGQTHMDPGDAMARLVALLLKGEGGFVERWFKVSSSCLGGASELMTPPDNFLWLLGPVSGGGLGLGLESGSSSSGECFRSEMFLLVCRLFFVCYFLYLSASLSSSHSLTLTHSLSICIYYIYIYLLLCLSLSLSCAHMRLSCVVCPRAPLYCPSYDT